MADSSSPHHPSDRHAIRLRGPWWCSPGPRFDEGRAIRVQWAADVEAENVDAFVMRRAFNRPTGLEAGDRVYLVAESVEHLRAIELNGQAVWTCEATESVTAVEVDIVETLQPVNQLDLTFALPRPAPPRVTGEVRLEIAEVR
ncbi:hypothetical protein [Roseimaritima ulvae]|uniref:Uncharacterized protein n=1 Tax=Roseimaritima ulvae TaxID=980254 RepID=A0A5B9QV41_9BACT|nr:hypothetical protein [Roseimaritima ulvae]QEG42894.1 hypothetical protein UC8_49360 [Roseimaritima ulvae]